MKTSAHTDNVETSQNFKVKLFEFFNRNTIDGFIDMLKIYFEVNLSKI